MTIYSEFPLEIVIFHSYVSLPEGNSIMFYAHRGPPFLVMKSLGKSSALPDEKSTVAHRWFKRRRVGIIPRPDHLTMASMSGWAVPFFWYGFDTEYSVQ